MASNIRVAVIGTGALGQHHARLYSALAAAGQCELVGVCDTDAARAKEIADKFGTVPLASLDEAAERADAISVVTPTQTHFAIASQLLKRGKHLLVEKPITSNPEEAGELVRLAKENGCVLQVGHVERFNPVFTYLTEAAKKPKFIEVHRLSPYPARSLDIGVVMDLMIHDIDIVLAFVNSPVKSYDAVGIPVLSGSEDIANVRLRFENGCVANVTASRVSAERLRKIRVFSAGEPPSYISLDYMRQKGFIFKLADESEKQSSLLKKLFLSEQSSIVSEFAGKKIIREPVPIQNEEPLKLELESFLKCAADKSNPVVSGETAKAALELAIQITNSIQECLRDEKD